MRKKALVLVLAMLLLAGQIPAVRAEDPMGKNGEVFSSNAVDIKTDLEEALPADLSQKEQPAADADIPFDPNAVETTPLATLPQSKTYVNPLYADRQEDSLPRFRQSLLLRQAPDTESETAALEEITYETNPHVLAANIRRALVRRQAVIPVHYICTVQPDDIEDELYYHAIRWAFDVTEHGNEGDYLSFQWGRLTLSPESCEIYEEPTSGETWYFYQYNIDVNYYTTAEEEAWMDEEIPKVVADFGFTDATPAWKKIQTIYDYVIHHVTYDHAHERDYYYDPQYTAYAALHDGTSVCQGYANLIYRLMWECGIPCRICGGNNHAWNMVALRDQFYYLDATWETEELDLLPDGQYQYFLMGSSQAEDTGHEHDFGIQWYAGEFTDYPIAQESYSKTTLDETDCTEHSFDDSFIVTNRDQYFTFYFSCPHCGAMYCTKAYHFFDQYDLQYLNEIPSRDSRIYFYAGEDAPLSLDEDLILDENTMLISTGDATLIVEDGALILYGLFSWNGDVQFYGNGRILYAVDVNEDGWVDKADLMALVRHVAGIALLDDSSLADANGDEMITAEDVSALAYILAA